MNRLTGNELVGGAIAAIGGDIGGAIGFSTAVNDNINHPNIYNPLNNQVVHLQSENSAIETLEHNHLLDGFSGKTALQGYLNNKASRNDEQIHSLVGREPQQIAGWEWNGFLTGSALTATVIAATGFVATVRYAKRHFRKTTPSGGSDFGTVDNKLGPIQVARQTWN